MGIGENIGVCVGENVGSRGGSFGDTTLPVVTTFVIPTTHGTYTIPITTFVATDNVGVTEYMITESVIDGTSAPAVDDVRWSAIKPTGYVVSADRIYVLWAWVKDAAGNINTPVGDSCIVSLAPVVGTPIYNTGAVQYIDTPGTYYFAEAITSDTDGIVIRADDVTIDGAFETLTFGSSNGSVLGGIRSPIFNARVNTTIKRCKIKCVSTGTRNLGIAIYGSNYAIFNNSIDNETGSRFYGIGATENEHRFAGVDIYQNFVQDRCPNNEQYQSGACIFLNDREATAYATVTDNVLVESHKGIVIQFGLNAFPTQQSVINKNQVSTNRIGWAKSAYCIASGKGRNILFSHNRATAKNGRGVSSDGYENSTLAGATHNTWLENAIGANYYEAEKAGIPYGDAYENVYGMRCRYASFNWTATSNYVFVTSTIANIVAGAYVGSDRIVDVNGTTQSRDLMTNLVMDGNIFLANDGNAAATMSAYKWQALNGLSLNDEQWQQEVDGVKQLFGWVDDAVDPAADNRLNVTEVNTTSFAPTPSVTVPQVTGLTLTKHFDTYVLEWDESAALDVWYYEILVDGVPEPQYMYSSRSPHANVPKPFWYDVDRLTTVGYSVTAVSLTGVKSAVSATISTVNAIDGWQ